MTGKRLISFLALTAAVLTAQTPMPPSQSGARVFGFRNFSVQQKIDREFLAVPDRDLARRHLTALASAPHWASSPEDYSTAQYVASRFRAAGLETEIVPYSVWMTRPVSALVEVFDATGRRIFSGPTREEVAAPPGSPAERFQSDPRVIAPFNSSSPAGDVSGPVVYANFGQLEDFRRLNDMGVSVKGKIVLVRYGVSFRGVKVYLAQRFGAAGVLIYSDPAGDDSLSKVEYPDGPARPDTAVQRGSVQFLPIYPGDPTTPGLASLPSLPAGSRLPASKLQNNVPSIPVQPLSWADTQPILRALGGDIAPHEWQGGGALTYRVGGTEALTVHLRTTVDARLRTIWNVIGRIPGSALPQEIVMAGNHRDSWVYGATDPVSGTAAMLETVHGLGALLSKGWRPRRTIMIASWDAEEEGLIGSTEWVEQHGAQMQRVVAYLNLDEAASGPNFIASSVPSLYRFLRDAAAQVPAPGGANLLELWRSASADTFRRTGAAHPTETLVGDLGSGSDYTPFFQHSGVPSTDIGSSGPFGVYHSVFDNLDWFTRFVDPQFQYTQQQARLLGIEILHMADADVLPYDNAMYADQIQEYLGEARHQAAQLNMTLDFTAAEAACRNFSAAGHRIRDMQMAPPREVADLNRALRAAESALLLPEGLPHRPWYKHSIYAPGEFTGYAAVPLPGVNDAVSEHDIVRAQAQLHALAGALQRAADVLNSVH